jgi:hypothetical protein
VAFLAIGLFGVFIILVLLRSLKRRGRVYLVGERTPLVNNPPVFIIPQNTCCSHHTNQTYQTNHFNQPPPAYQYNQQGSKPPPYGTL